MAFKLDGIQHQAPAVTGAQDYFPVANGGFVFSGDVKWGLFFGTFATANNTLTSKPRLMVGLVDAAGNQSLLKISGLDAVSTSAWNSRLENTVCMGSMDETGVLKSAAVASIQPNGIRLTFSTVDATNAYRICGIVGGGSGVEASLVNVSFVGGAPETKTVNHGLSAAPTRYFILSSAAIFASNSAQGRANFGFGMVGGAQEALFITRLGSQTTEQCAAYASSTVSGGQLASGGTLDYTVTAQNFTATQADLVTNATAGTDGISVLFMRIPNDGGKVGTFDWPTNTTEFTAATGATKQPSAVITFNSMLTGLDAGSISANSDFFGLGCAWLSAGAMVQMSAGINTQDAATGTLSSKSITSSALAQMPNPAGSATQLLGNATSFTADGFKAQAATADVTVRKSLYMLFGDVSPTPIITAVTPIVMGTSFTITGTNFSASGNAVTIGGVAQTLTGQSITLLTIALPTQGSTLRYGDLYDLVATNSTGQSSVAISVFIDIEPTLDYENLEDPLIPAAARVEGLPDLAGGFQIAWDDITAVTTNSGQINTTLGVTRTMKVRVHDGSVWSATATDRSDWTVITLHILPTLTNPIARGILRLLRKIFLTQRHTQQFPL